MKTGPHSYQYLITNLPYAAFSTDDIKAIYHHCWGCEVAFRYLKHAAAEENRKKKRNPDNRYRYDVDVSNTIRTVRKYLLRKSCRKPVDLLRLTMKYVHAVKDEFRSFDRNLRGIGAVHFHYR